MAKDLFFPGTILGIHKKAVDKLLAAGSGDAALLYLALLAGKDGGALAWDRPRLEAAHRALLELGLAGEPAVSVHVLGQKCGDTGDAAERCKRLLDQQYQRTLALLKTHVAALDALAQALLEHEALDGREAEEILDSALSNERQETTACEAGGDRTERETCMGMEKKWRMDN